jgi:pyrroloquinoline quinone (PQQ) biosynthesis protein C
MTDPRLDRIVDANDRLNRHELELRDAVLAARRGPNPVAWRRIAEALGVSRQTVYSRFHRTSTHRK